MRSEFYTKCYDRFIVFSKLNNNAILIVEDREPTVIEYLNNMEFMKKCASMNLLKQLDKEIKKIRKERE